MQTNVKLELRVLTGHAAELYKTPDYSRSAENAYSYQQACSYNKACKLQTIQRTQAVV